MTPAPKRTITINELGRRIGDSHHLARLTNHEVELLLDLREEGWGYRRLSAKFDISKTAARKMCKGLTRCQTPAAWKVIQG